MQFFITIIFTMLLNTLCFSQTFSVTSFIENYAKNHIASGNTAGMSVAVVSRGEVLFTKVYGYSDYENLQLLKHDNIFNVGYISKLYTAVAVMKLLQDKKITLHSMYDNYLLHVMPHNDSGITVKSLLTQSAGIVDPIIDTRVRKPSDVKPLGMFLYNNIPEFFVSSGVLVSNSEYSYSLLGLIVESVTKQHFEEYMKNSIFLKHDLLKTSFSPSYVNDNLLKEVKYYNIEDGKLKFMEKTYSNMIPAQGLVTNIDDIAKFISFFDKNLILKKRFKDMLFLKQFDNSDSIFSTSFIFNSEKYKGVEYYSLLGGNAAPGCSIFYLPKEDRYFIFLSNTFNADLNKRFMQDYIDINPTLRKIDNADDHFIGYNRDFYGVYNYSNIPSRDFTKIFKIFNYITISGYTLYGDDTYLRIKYHGRYPSSFLKDEIFYPIDQYIYKSKDRNLYIKIVNSGDKKYVINSGSYQDVFSSSGFSYYPFIQQFFFLAFIILFPISFLYYFLKKYTHFSVFLICAINVLYLTALFYMLFYTDNDIYSFVYFAGSKKIIMLIFTLPIISLIVNILYYKKIKLLITMLNFLFFIFILSWRAIVLFML